MNKKLWFAAAAAIAVCIAGSGGISVFGGAAKKTFLSSKVSPVVTEQKTEPVEEAEEKEENVTVIDLSMTGAYKNADAGDGYKIFEDGTFIAYTDFEEQKGKFIGTVLPEGGEWVFTSPVFDQGKVTGTYEDKVWTIDGKAYTETFSSIEVTGLHFRGLYANGKSLFIWGRSMQNLEKNDLECTADLTQVMQPREISDEITVTFDGAEAKVRAINPYEKQAPLSDCLICCFYTEDTTGTFSYEIDGHACGEECFDQLLEQDVYSYEKDRLVYKEYIAILSDFDFESGEDARGEKILNPSGDCNLTFNFDGAALKSFCYTSSEMLYYGLDKNLDESTLEGMSEEEMQQAAETRSRILDGLTKEIDESGSDVNIDRTTGEIDMDSKVLFDVNSCELSEEGKHCLDQFVKVYLPVLFSDEVKDEISNVVFEGHTDSDGSFGHNMDLSARRARAVLDYCLESSENGLTEAQKTMLKDKAITRGYASTEPVYDENGKEDKDASRRVAVKFYLKAD